MPDEIQSQVAGQARATARWNNELSKTPTDSFFENTNFSRLPDATLKDERTPEALDRSIGVFKDFFDTQMDNLTDGMNDTNVKEFKRIAEEKFSEICKSAFHGWQDRLRSGDSLGSSRHIREHMNRANEQAMKFLKSIELDATRAPIAALRKRAIEASADHVVKPQIFARKEEEGGGFNLISNPVKIENFVLSGGGGKGIGYPPAIGEMNRTGQLDGLKQVVGTSAGALTAVALSVGLSPDELSDLSNDLDMNKLLRTDEEIGRLYPQLHFEEQWQRVLGGNAEGMVHFLDRLVGDKVAAGLKAFAEEAGRVGETEAFRKYAEDGRHMKNFEQVLDRVGILKNPNYEKDRSGQMVTFSDMEMMHALAPDKFKEIRLTGFHRKRLEHGKFSERVGEVKIFNADTTPDLPVAFAARISMAHPAIASGVKLDPDLGVGGGPRFNVTGYGEDYYTDGGTGSNVPLEAVFGGDVEKATSPVEGGTDEDVARGRKLAATAVLIFDDKGKAYTTLHGPPERRNVAASALERHFGVTDEALTADREKAYRGHTFIVFHGDVGTLDVKPDDDKAHFAKASATFNMLKQINDRCNQPLMQQTETVEQAFELLSDDEKKLLLSDGPPSERGGPSEELYNMALAWDERNKSFA